MNKKILSVLLVLCLVLCSFVGCSEDAPEVSMDEVMTYDYENLSQYIKMGEYLGVEYSKDCLDIVEGDVCSIDFVGKIDGKEFEGGSGSYDLTIGSGSFIDGFEDGLIGHQVGEKVSLNLAFPDDYTTDGENISELAGKDVVFDVTINAVNGCYSEEEVYEAQIWNNYFNSCEIIAYPEKEFNIMKQQQVEYYEVMAEAYGFTEFTEFLDVIGLTEEEFEQDMVEYAEGMVAQDLALLAIADKEGIEPKKESIETATQLLFESYGVANANKFEKEYGMTVDDPRIQASINMTALLYDIMELMVENAVAID